MTIKTEPYKFAEFVDTEDDIRLYLSIFLEEDGEEGFNDALNHLSGRLSKKEILDTDCTDFTDKSTLNHCLSAKSVSKKDKIRLLRQPAREKGISKAWARSLWVEGVEGKETINSQQPTKN